MENGSTTLHIQRCLDRLQAGDGGARDELLRNAADRLETLARRMLRGFPGVRRWEQTGDVRQNAMLRLWKALDQVVPPTALEFFKLASTQIRRELIDLARHHFGPMGGAAHHATSFASPAGGEVGAAAVEREGSLQGEPERLALWTEFHEQVDKLPAGEREVFDLLWYQGLRQEEAASLLGVSTRTIKNRWRNARILLHEALGGELPET